MSQRSFSAAFWDPDSDDDSRRVDLPTELNRPDVGSSGGSKSTTHEVLDGEDVVQHLGPKSLEYDISGSCFPQDASTIERYGELPRVRARLPDRGTRDMLVTDVSIDPTQTYYESGGSDGDGAYLKDFSITAVELTGSLSEWGRSTYDDSSPYDDGTNLAPDTPSSL